jgi:hypothetical protein
MQLVTATSPSDCRPPGNQGTIRKCAFNIKNVRLHALAAQDGDGLECGHSVSRSLRDHPKWSLNPFVLKWPVCNRCLAIKWLAQSHLEGCVPHKLTRTMIDRLHHRSQKKEVLICQGSNRHPQHRQISLDPVHKRNPRNPMEPDDAMTDDFR